MPILSNRTSLAFAAAIVMATASLVACSSDDMDLVGGGLAASKEKKKAQVTPSATTEQTAATDETLNETCMAVENAENLNTSLTAARYWRAINDTPLAEGWCFNELVFFNGKSGKKALTDKTQIATRTLRSSNYDDSDWNFKYAFDGVNNSDVEHAGCNSGEEKERGIGLAWVGWDFGPGNEVLVLGVTAAQMGHPFHETWTIASMKIQSSADAVAWTDEWRVPKLAIDAAKKSTSEPTTVAVSVRAGCK